MGYPEAEPRVRKPCGFGSQYEFDEGALVLNALAIGVLEVFWHIFVVLGAPSATPIHGL